jgi:hypothetical protein
LQAIEVSASDDASKLEDHFTEAQLAQLATSADVRSPTSRATPTISCGSG